MEKKKKEKKSFNFRKNLAITEFQIRNFSKFQKISCFRSIFNWNSKEEIWFISIGIISKFLSVSLSFIQAKEYIGQRRTIYHCPSSLRRSHEDRVKRMKISKTCSTVLKKVEGCRVTEEDGKLISPKGETKARIRTHFSLQWTHFFLSFLPLSLPYHVEAISREDYLLKAFSVLVAVNGGKRGII